MLQLPNSKDLPIGILTGCFGSTVATYKFYWFLSIIEAVESGKTTIDKKEIFIKMVASFSPINIILPKERTNNNKKTTFAAIRLIKNDNTNYRITNINFP